MFDTEEVSADTVEIQEPASERQLATVRVVSELLPIEGADRIELAQIDGWNVIVKKGEYQVGDLAIYLEIDSWVPSAIAPFLTREGKTPREYQGIPGERLRTMKMRGEISQGLLLPLSVADAFMGIVVGRLAFQEGDDLTQLLGILKWEREIPACLRGKAAGNFPGELRKTDQTRVQNAKRILGKDDQWEMSIKLDGSSMTAFIDADDVFWVCSRNLKLTETEDNAFWKQARAQDLEAKLRQINADVGRRVALQGELIGPGIQGNQEKLDEPRFYLFDIFDIQSGHYVLPAARQVMANIYGIDHVPIAGTWYGSITVPEALAVAEGPSLNPTVMREGIVFKSCTRQDVSFKAVSNNWLLSKGE